MMKSTATPHSHITAADYLEGEQYSQVRHEYIDGAIYAMGGASDKHGLIAGNVFAKLNSALPDSCQAFISDMKVHIQIGAQEIFYYPDIVVSCAQDDRETYYREKPILIVEVLSSSTERLDRYEKFSNYIELISLQEYVLIEQRFRLIELCRRSNRWDREIVTQGMFRLESVNLDLSVDEIYRRVSWG